MQNAIEKLGATRIKQMVAHLAEQLNIPSELHIDYVCSVCCDNLDLAPNINGRKKKNLFSAEECVEQWVLKFKHGYDERISVRKSKLPGTVPDKAVNIILSTGLHCHYVDHIQSIIYAHRLGMSAENILGLLLEEFLFNRLSPFGWAMAWGETIKSVDFCNAEGFLLQVKNRSNSENSSSSQIRSGKPIEKWFRVNATNGRYQWDELNAIVGSHSGLELNEKSFQEFIEDVLKKNPAALAIEPDNPWLRFLRQKP